MEADDVVDDNAVGGGRQASAETRERRVIALVDDDRNILTTVSIALQAEGFATRVYSDGEAALKALVENPPDLGGVRHQDAADGRDGAAAPGARADRRCR